MPIQKQLYPADWPAISYRIRFERAKGRCEWCGVLHDETHPVTGSRVLLTVAHLGIPKPDGTPGRITGLSIRWIQSDELVVGEECAEQVAHLHIDITFAKSSPRDFGCRFWNTWDRLRLQGHHSPTFCARLALSLILSHVLPMSQVSEQTSSAVLSYVTVYYPYLEGVRIDQFL